MESALLPPNEEERIEALHALKVLDTPPEEAFERITSLAARVFDAPIAGVSLVDREREWFKACYGTDTRQANRKIAFCAHTILSNDVLVVEDALQDPRFFDNPQVIEGGVRFYVGAPLRSATGQNVGALCLKDTRTRTFSQQERHILVELAALVSREFQLRLAADELVATNNKLATKNRELDEFTYVASHDLQEPIRKIVSFSKLLMTDLGDDLNERVETDLGFIVAGAERMQQLIQDLLALSRATTCEPKHESVAMDACVDEALLSLSLAMEQSGAVVERDPLPEFKGDARLITQLYQNLLDNALKFVPAGTSPRVRVTCEEIDGTLVFGVLDRGIGVDEKYEETIFVPFKRLHAKSEYAGTGIGLAICKKAVGRHEGELWYESSEGGGSHFRFTLATSRPIARHIVGRARDRQVDGAVVESS